MEPTNFFNGQNFIIIYYWRWDILLFMSMRTEIFQIASATLSPLQPWTSMARKKYFQLNRPLLGKNGVYFCAEYPNERDFVKMHDIRRTAVYGWKKRISRNFFCAIFVTFTPQRKYLKGSGMGNFARGRWKTESRPAWTTSLQLFLFLLSSSKIPLRWDRPWTSHGIQMPNNTH